MNTHSNQIEWFRCLLVDISLSEKCPLDAPSNLAYEWLVIDAPLLEKQVLSYIEGSRAENPDFPEWLKPLWDIFVLYKRGETLRSIRQLLLFCYKTEHEPTTQQLQEAQKAFEEVDRTVGVWNHSFSSYVLPSHTFREARRYVSSIIYRANWQEIEPSHGPGGIYPTRNPSDKSKFCTIYTKIQQYYPADQYYCGLPSFWDDHFVHERTGQLSESECITAKLVAVPKDSRGPRLICVHPAEAIWIQQGQRQVLERCITTSYLTRGKINFTDQTVNGKLALESSKSGYMCTLDLKEASDRIGTNLVRYLFGDYVYDLISCARASSIRLLDGRVIELNKWAPMGNALCFPVQSLVFYSLVRAGIRCRYGVTCDDIYVFGDDILFPACYYEGAIGALVSAGLVPNINKTFRKGLFRESCGVDAYNGIDVTPLRIRKWDVSSVSSAISLCEVASRLRRKGFEHCSASIYKTVRKRWGKLPYSNNPDCQGLFEYVDRDFAWLLLNEPNCRFRQRFHKWAVRGRMLKSRCISVPNGDWYHLQDSLLRIARMGDKQSDRGTEYPDPYQVRLTYGWSDCLLTAR